MVKCTSEMSELDWIDIILIGLNITLIVLITVLHIQANASDCRGQLISKTKSSDGHICTRQAKLSIHDIGHTSEQDPMHR